MRPVQARSHRSSAVRPTTAATVSVGPDTTQVPGCRYFLSVRCEERSSVRVSQRTAVKLLGIRRKTSLRRYHRPLSYPVWPDPQKSTSHRAVRPLRPHCERALKIPGVRRLEVRVAQARSAQNVRVARTCRRRYPEAAVRSCCRWHTCSGGQTVVTSALPPASAAYPEASEQTAYLHGRSVRRGTARYAHRIRGR